jgi:hypothetical protein
MIRRHEYQASQHWIQHYRISNELQFFLLICRFLNAYFSHFPLLLSMLAFSLCFSAGWAGFFKANVFMQSFHTKKHSCCCFQYFSNFNYSHFITQNWIGSVLKSLDHLLHRHPSIWHYKLFSQNAAKFRLSLKHYVRIKLVWFFQALWRGRLIYTVGNIYCY